MKTSFSGGAETDGRIAAVQQEKHVKAGHGFCPGMRQGQQFEAA
ncbi:hypothetical protein [Ochrobactrum sp. Marseille-Q0166]|nr:hypothetical protein [Ochrobactrum sp. Marseille-Q0166]